MVEQADNNLNGSDGGGQSATSPLRYKEQSPSSPMIPDKQPLRRRLTFVDEKTSQVSDLADISAKGGRSRKSGILKNNQSSLSLLKNLQQIPAVTQQKTITKKAPSRALTVNWRDKRERMELYMLQKQFEFGDIRQQHIDNLIFFNQQDAKGPRRTLYTKQIKNQTDCIMHVVEQTPLEKLQNYEDRWPLLNLRKTVKRSMLNVKNFAKEIISTKAFDRSCILVIVVNSATLAMEDPNAVSTTPLQDQLEVIFLTLYTIEMVLKIMGLGFLFSGEESYIRDPWNMLDFTIVISSYFTIAQEMIEIQANGGQKKLKTHEYQDEGGFSLASLRAFRVLRPLKAITSIRGLQTLVAAVIESLPLLKDTVLVLMAFFLVFAIAGTQLLTGQLKKRCVSIEDGTLYDEEYLCGSMNKCPDGYFCGKQNANPNFGVTNFDNILFSLLVVFQCITLEGWSDIMVQFQQCYSAYSFMLFLPVVFIGAFFLVNLTLAVINSSFSQAQKKQEQRLKAEEEKRKIYRKKDTQSLDGSEPITQIGVRQYWVAQRATKKLLQNLRERQARLAAEKKQEEQGELEEEKVVTELLTGPVKKEKCDESQSDDYEMQLYNFLEDQNDDDQPKLKVFKKDKNKEIKKYAVSEMRVAHRLTKSIFGIRDNKKEVLPIETVDAKQLAVKEPGLTSKQYQGTMADPSNVEDMLDVTNLLDQADRQDISQSSCMHPFDLSQNHSEAIDYAQDSEDESMLDPKPKQANAADDISQPTTNAGPQKVRKAWQDSELSSVIVSDSSFEQNIDALDIYRDERMRIKQVEEKYSTNQKLNGGSEQLEKTKTQSDKKKQSEKELVQFKVETPPVPINGVDKHGEPLSEDFDDDPARKIAKKKKKKKKGKRKTDAAGPDAKYLLFKSTIQSIDDRFKNSTEPSKNPFDFINKKTHKIEILPDYAYVGSSQSDVFEIRNKVADQMALQDLNQFVKAAKSVEFPELNKDEEMEEALQEYAKPTFQAYQQKIAYKIFHEDPVEFDEDDDDALIMALQPFDTVMSVGYGLLLTHKPVKFIARRSDIIVSSTLQLTLVPSDSGYRPYDHALMSPEQIQEWCHTRHQFRALSIETAKLYKDEDHNDTTMMGKRETMRANLLMTDRMRRSKTGEQEHQDDLLNNDDQSSFNRTKSGFQKLDTLQTFKTSILDASVMPTGIMNRKNTERRSQGPQRMIPPTLLTKPIPPEKLNNMMEDEKRLYNIQKGKYDTYMRICQKKEQQGEHPRDRRFKLEDCAALMAGKHHEDDEEDDLIDNSETPMNYLGREDSFKEQKIEHFEQQARKILRRKFKRERPNQVYVPQLLRTEFDLPDDLGDDTINFHQVMKMDCSKKRNTPMWSGQDVLEIGLTSDLSSWVISRINAVRVWPKGIMGYLKKVRVLLKMIVKHSIFDSAMTFCVMLNTIVMGMDHYGIDEEMFNTLEFAGTIFTYIFIGEMTSKMIAVGPKKYFQDKMNWLDFAVVSTSLVEIIMGLIGGSGGNLSAFKTLRVLRTFRVLRVARLLRAMKETQTILAVIQRSAESIFYIILLMFVFIFIYTLLGMQIFGGNFDFADGKPRGNYDSFVIAFLTVFQILTTENWNSVLYDSMRNESIGQVAPAIFYVTWIFIGNFILLNLFLAILLDGFLNEDEEIEGDLEMIQMLEAQKHAARIEKEKKRRLKKMGAKIDFSAEDDSKVGQKKSQVEEICVDDVDDLDEKAIREIFMDVGLIKKKDKEREKRLMYQGIKCEVSQYLFTKQNRFRIMCVKIMKHKVFDNFIMLLIGLSSVKLAADSYLVYLDPESPEVKISELVDIVLNILFTFECMIKQVALGTIMEEGSYLRESWNQLDGFIVFTSLLDMSLTGVEVPVIKILRLLRTLRPLRVISHNSAMKFILASLFNSVSALFSAIVVVIAVWLMFAIFAINIFQGKFFYCSIGSFTYHTKYECNVAGGTWLRAEQNFDDIFQAMQTLFNISTLEGWPDVMLYGIDATEKDYGPELEASGMNGFFFVVFILIGSFFLMNFFTGILFVKYEAAAKQDKQGYTPEALTWIAIQRFVVEQRCPHDLMNKPDKNIHPQKYKYWNIVTNLYFEYFIMTVIVINIVQMGINFENAPLLYVFLLESSDYIFTLIFVAEAYLKLRAYSIQYFDTISNQFDFFIVLSSIADVIMGFAAASVADQFALGPQIARMLRVLRVTRVVRIASKNEGLKALMQTITMSIGSLANVFLLLMLALFIFSILAVFFFSPITTGNVIDEFRNFNDFGQSFLLLFVITTGENWNMLIYDCNKTLPGCTPGEDCGVSFAPAFYIVFVLVIQNVMLNLFILVIIQQFDLYYISPDNPIKKYQNNKDIFLKTWVFFTATKSRCVKLREKKLSDFFRKLPLPIGLPAETTDDQMKKILLKMGVKCDDGYIYFNELLYRCMRRLYGNFSLNRRMQIEELKTQFKIYQLKLKAQQGFLGIGGQPTHEKFFKTTVGSGKSVNPFLQEMYFHISFNTWLNYSRRQQRREQFESEQAKNQQEAWARGEEFTPAVLREPEAKVKNILIEVEEIFYVTTEDNESSSDEEVIQPMKRTLTMAELKSKKTVRPFVGSSKSSSLFKSVFAPKKGKNSYKLARKKEQKSDQRIVVSGAESNILKKIFFDKKADSVGSLDGSREDISVVDQTAQKPLREVIDSVSKLDETNQLEEEK